MDRMPVRNNVLEAFQVKVSERTSGGVHLHWHDFYELELYRSGTGTTEINGVSYALLPDTLVLITPTDYHSFAADGAPIELLNLTFTPACVDEEAVRERLELSGFVVARLDPETAERLVWLMRRLRAEYTADAPYSRSYTASLMTCILAEVLRQNQNGLPDLSDKPIQKAAAYLRGHYREPVTLEQLARLAGFSPSHFSTRFHAVMGVGYKEYLISLRLERAKVLLRLSDQSVTEIAAGCGFCSLSHFLHVFRVRCGMTPVRYRKTKQVIPGCNSGETALE